MAIHITRGHPYDKHTARIKVQHVAEELAQDLSLRYAWEGDRLLFKRTGARGHIEVSDHAVEVYLRTSRLLPVPEKWLRQQIEAHLTAHLPESGP